MGKFDKEGMSIGQMLFNKGSLKHATPIDKLGASFASRALEAAKKLEKSQQAPKTEASLSGKAPVVRVIRKNKEEEKK